MEKIIIAEERYGRKTLYFADDDFIDRLNNRLTVMVLVMCIFIITGNIYVGKPINCWTPAEFKGQHDGYANSVCWLKGSYYLPTDEIHIPDRSKPRIYHISYYQWTPFILLGMALLFLFPKAIWHTFTRKSGFNIRRLVQMIKEKPDAEKGVDFVRCAMKNYIETLNRFHGSICCGFRCQNVYFSFSLMYLIIKFLYLINTIAQFFLLNAFLSFNFTRYGIEAIDRMFSEGDEWFESPRFPRVTMCDFMVRRLGSNQHWYAVQCNLPINMYNEKIFLGIWLWLIVLTILNIISIIIWFLSMTKKRRLATVKKYLRIMREIPSKRERLLSRSRSDTYDSREEFEDFVHYLHADGFLIFRIIARNTDEVAAGQIIEYLYRNFEPPVRNHFSDV